MAVRVCVLVVRHAVRRRDGVYTPAVAMLEDYFKCFDVVYVGGADNHHIPDMYCQGVVNASATASWVARSASAARKFADEHPHLGNYAWYLDYEAAGNYFGTGCTHFTPGPPLPRGVATPATFQPRTGGSSGNSTASRRSSGTDADAGGDRATPGTAPGGGALAAAPTRPMPQSPPPPPAVSAASFTDGYAKMFSPLTEALASIKDLPVMWSPTFNDPAASITYRATMLDNLARLFTAAWEKTGGTTIERGYFAWFR